VIVDLLSRLPLGAALAARGAPSGVTLVGSDTSPSATVLGIPADTLP